jgi:hypothetical protein
MAEKVTEAIKTLGPARHFVKKAPQITDMFCSTDVR